jgi:hypothetical protein
MVADNRVIEGVPVTPAPPEIPRITTKKEKGPVEMTVLFTIDDVDYSVPTHTAPNMSLKYLWLLKKEGAAAANFYMLTVLLGEEGYEALMNYDDLSQEDYDAVLAAANKIMLGKDEAPKDQPGTNG